MPTPTSKHNEPPASQAGFFVPNRLSLKDIQYIEKEMGKGQHICWIVEEGIPASADIYEHFQQQRAEGFLFKPSSESPQIIAQKIKKKLQENKHVILIPTKKATSQQDLHDFDASSIDLLQQLQLKIEPLYCYENDSEEATVCLLNSIAPSPASSAQLLSAWTEGSARAFSKSRGIKENSLAQLLIAALQNNSDSTLCNGIDGRSIYYHQLLKDALLCAKHLRKNYSKSQRIGILLPPSPDAILANLACIFAGCTPVNLNYKQSIEQCQAQAEGCKLKRYITQASTSNQFHQQNWIHQRDLIYLDQILEAERRKPFQFSQLRTLLGSTQSLLKWIGYLQPEPQSEALIITSKGLEDTQSKSIPLTHRQILAQLLQLEQIPSLTQPRSILCRQAYHQGSGLMLGLLLPLRCGQNIITYPDESKLEQFVRLTHEHQIQLAHITPPQLQQVLQGPSCTQELQSLQHLIVSGEPLHPQIKQYAQQQWGIKIHNAYSISQACALVSLSSENPEPTATMPTPAQQASQSYIVGRPLHGTAVRIGNPNIYQRNIPLGELGGLWIKGPSTNSKEWIATGDIASMNSRGQLSIYGRRQRYSRIGGQLIPHQHVEQILYQFYKITPSAEPQLAIISICANDSEQIILLSTVHKDFNANDYITLRYGLSNQKYPREWCPNKVLYITKIPLLSNGMLDYQQCCTLSYQALGYKQADPQKP